MSTSRKCSLDGQSLDPVIAQQPNMSAEIEPQGQEKEAQPQSQKQETEPQSEKKETEFQCRKKAREDQPEKFFFNPYAYPEIPWDDGDWDEFPDPTWFEEVKWAVCKFLGNFWPDVQYLVKKYLSPTKVPLWIIVGLIAIFWFFFRLTLEPRYAAVGLWHVQRHNNWLYQHGIRESTWILDDTAQSHTSNDPALVDDVLLQFPQRHGGASLALRDVRFDSNAYYGVISMAKLEKDHVPLMNKMEVGDGKRPVLGVELIGRGVVAMNWGSKGTYILKAWSLECGWWCWIKSWVMFWRIRAKEIPAETMRELVNKHQKYPAAAEDDESTTPWEQRALDKEFETEKSKRASWWF